MFGASLLLSPHLFMCDPAKGPSHTQPPIPYISLISLYPTALPEPILSNTENKSLASDSVFKVFWVSYGYPGSLKVAQFPLFPKTPLLTEINHHL